MPRGLTFEQFEAGSSYESQARTVTEADVVAFAGISGDFNSLHMDAIFASKTPIGERIAHGMLIASMATGMSNWTGIFEGTTIALMEQTIRYRDVVKLGDTVKLKLTVADKKETTKQDRGIVFFNTEILNQDGTVVIDGQWTLLMKRVIA